MSGWFVVTHPIGPSSFVFPVFPVNIILGQLERRVRIPCSIISSFQVLSLFPFCFSGCPLKPMQTGLVTHGSASICLHLYTSHIISDIMLFGRSVRGLTAAQSGIRCISPSNLGGGWALKEGAYMLQKEDRHTHTHSHTHDMPELSQT